MSIKPANKYKTFQNVIEHLLIHESYVARNVITKKAELRIYGKQYKQIALKIARLFV